MCQKDKNVDFKDNSKITKNINTEAAEQQSSVLKQYHNALPSYSGQKFDWHI